MPVRFTIKVTKEVLRLSKKCGTHDDDLLTIGKNCAIAIALKDIFPGVFVMGDYIYPFGIDEKNNSDHLKITMPKVARDFINVFDSLRAIPNCRLLLPEFEFEIAISDEIISQINIDEIRTVICLNREIAQRL